MMKANLVLKLLPVLLTAFAFAPDAHAAAVRTFVSSAGNDGNAGSNCPRLSPCRNFAAAYAVTTSGGEIVALDAAGYGTITINSGVTIIGVEGALISVPTGTAGVTVNAGSNLVLLRNILITGAGASNTTGVDFNSGKLVLDNCTLKQLTTGLDVANSKVDVVDSEIIGNTTGVSTTGTGVDTQAFPNVGPTQVRFWGGAVLDNTTAYVMNDPGLRPNPATDNKITIFMHTMGNSITTQQAGNTTLISGTGGSCSDPNNCKATSKTEGQVNYNLN